MFEKWSYQKISTIKDVHQNINFRMKINLKKQKKVIDASFTR